MSGISSCSKYSDTNSDIYLSGQVTANACGVEAKVGASRASNRQFVFLQNTGGDTVYFGPSGISVSNMVPLERDQFVEIAIGDMELTLKTASGTVTVVVQEIG